MFFFTLFFLKGRTQRANKDSRGSTRIMFNFSQGARGNVGKVNRPDRFTPTCTSHTAGWAEITRGRKKKSDKNGETRRLGPAAETKGLWTGSSGGELNIWEEKRKKAILQKKSAVVFSLPSFHSSERASRLELSIT